MPRVSERSQALQAIESAIEVTAWVYALALSSEEEDELEEDLKDPLTTSEVIASSRYLEERVLVVMVSCSGPVLVFAAEWLNRAGPDRNAGLQA